MSYPERKRERDRALIAAIHGTDEPELTAGPVDFDGGGRGDDMPRGEPRPLPLTGEPRELGWGHEVELEGGAELLMPWLRAGTLEGDDDLFS